VAFVDVIPNCIHIRHTITFEHQNQKPRSFKHQSHKHIDTNMTSIYMQVKTRRCNLVFILFQSSLIQIYVQVHGDNNFKVPSNHNKRPYLKRFVIIT
jgi:hypothetical protein